MIGGAKTLVGEVVSSKMQKTVVVKVQRTVRDPLYKKVVRLRTKFKAHDEGQQCRVGDKVRMVQCRPMSKEKHWQVVEILVRAKASQTALDGRTP